MGVACLKFHGEKLSQMAVKLRKLASSPWKYAEVECVQHEDVSNEKTTINLQSYRQLKNKNIEFYVESRAHMKLNTQQSKLQQVNLNVRYSVPKPMGA